MNIQRLLGCALILSAMILFSGCNSADESAPATATPSTPEPAATAPAASTDAPVDTSSQRIGTMHFAAQDACLVEVASTTGADISTLKIIMVQGVSNLEVYVTVPDAEAPWVCQSDPDGNVSKVFLKGSEG